MSDIKTIYKALHFFNVTTNRIKSQKPANSIIYPINIHVYDTKTSASFYAALAVTRNNSLVSSQRHHTAASAIRHHRATEFCRL